MVKQGYGGLDRFRLVAAILVITIHTSPLWSVWEDGDFFLTSVLARIGVPFFWMVTGQFVLGGGLEERDRTGKIKRFLRNNLFLYAVAILLYLPIGIYAGHYQNLHIGTALRMLVFDGTFYHLWYFPASILGVLLVEGLYRRFGLRNVAIVSVVLYVLGLLGDSYYGLIQKLPVLSTVYEWLFQICSYTRNGLFFAPLFLVMGAWSKEQRKPASGIGLVTAFVCMTIEAFLLRYFQLPRHDSMYVFLPVVMWFLYLLLLRQGGSSSRYVRKIAAWIYILHPAVLVAVRGIATATKTTAFWVENSILHFLAVALLSALAALLVTAGTALARDFYKEQRYVCGRAWIELDRAALRRNVEFLSSRLPKECELMPAVKAEAYGHGAVLMAKELARLGVQAFCVATAEEGANLRRHGIKGEILVLGYTHPRQFPLLVRWHLTQTVVDYAYAGQLNRYGRGISVHIGVDTGMHRLGERSENKGLICQMFEMKNLRIKGLFTHLCADDTMGEQEQAFTRKQVEAFGQVVSALKERGIACPKVHMQASYGLLHYPELGGDYARIGIALYGVLSSKEDTEIWKEKLSPVLSLWTRVATVKELKPGETAGYGLQFVAEKPTKLAVLTIGYADGLPRSLGNGVGSVLIRGQRAPIVGLICMDQTLVDVSGITGVRPKDTAVLIGRSGENEILASDLAKQTGTITNEILSRLGARLERIVVEPNIDLSEKA